MSKRGSTLSVRTKLQNQLIWMICAAMAVPTLILGGSICLLVTRLSMPDASVPPHEAIAEVTRYIAVLFPGAIAILLYWAFKGTDRLVGPIERMVRELDQHIAGQRSGPIVLRPGDQLIPLANTINTLLEERDKLKNAQNQRVA